ncbi:hypothetical protein HRbin26_02235 [bacterium HR26]|nr:hypothetical protein HRbin26_02235 [bacterium HR26]
MAIDEETALRLAGQAVDRAGGSRYVYNNPRHPFAHNAVRTFEIEGYQVVVRFGEISSPAIVEVEGWVFEVREEGLVTLFGPSFR